MIGRIVLTGICVVAIVLSIWSYQVVRTFLNFFSAMLESGAALENANKLRGGIYEKLRNVYAGPGAHKSLRLWTTSFFLVFFLAWIVLFVFAWV